MTNIMRVNNRNTAPTIRHDEGIKCASSSCDTKGGKKKIFNDTDLMECLLCVTLRFLYGFLIEVTL